MHLALDWVATLVVDSLLLVDEMVSMTGVRRRLVLVGVLDRLVELGDGVEVLGLLVPGLLGNITNSPVLSTVLMTRVERLAVTVLPLLADRLFSRFSSFAGAYSKTFN